MKPYHESNGVRIFHGNALDVLPALESESVNCCVTSPPYWGLRDYGTAEWDGGDAACDHVNDTAHQKQGATSQRNGRSNVDAQKNDNFRNTCGKCGAVRVDAQLGLEPTPQEYVANVVAVFREVRRVLRDDGTLWLNLGDSYASTSTYNTPRTSGGEYGRVEAPVQPNAGIPLGLKPKDLIGIPWRVAFALQADGWYLRSDIIWHKPNPMPESVTDRPTKAHEYLFLLTKSPRYFYDHEAIKEGSAGQGGSAASFKRDTKEAEVPGQSCKQHRTDREDREDDGKRNRRSVWTVATKPYPGAHFAVFPPKLIEPCILAGCPKGGTVLDPFYGSGTTGQVAQANGCKAIGIELNAEYIDLAVKRTEQGVLF